MYGLGNAEMKQYDWGKQDAQYSLNNVLLGC